MNKSKKTGITLLKLVFSSLLIYFVIEKVDFSLLHKTFLKTNLYYLFIALFFFIISKVISAFRLHLYLKEISVPISQKSNLRLYLLGMFYNLFLPSGIGGDAYKGYLIKKIFDITTKKIAAVLLIDRLSGLVVLAILAIATAIYIHLPIPQLIQWLLPIGIPVGLVVLWSIHTHFFKYLKDIFWKSLAFSFFVQIAQMISIVFILLSLSIENQHLPYLLIFLISSIVSILPVTIGGIGAREITFFYGAQWFGIQEHYAISVSLIFFFLTAVVSFCGIYYHFKKPDITQ